eukprot:COSAG02_NODE_264_length_26618_cov_244.096459_18_plen_58_part_00
MKQTPRTAPSAVCSIYDSTPFSIEIRVMLAAACGLIPDPACDRLIARVWGCLLSHVH